jgi:hypothetical protein
MLLFMSMFRVQRRRRHEIKWAVALACCFDKCFQ